MNRCQNTSSKLILHGENTLCLLNPLHCCLTQIRKIRIIDVEKFNIFDVKSTILRQFRQIQSILTFFSLFGQNSAIYAWLAYNANFFIKKAHFWGLDLLAKVWQQKLEIRAFFHLLSMNDFG